MKPGPSLGVVIPTLNTLAHLPKHLEAFHQWGDLVQQVVVVDSYSTDGTFDYLRKNLKHSNVEFIQRPPGLYAAWNAGIGELKSRYTYVSTIGDTISRDGIVH